MDQSDLPLSPTTSWTRLSAGFHGGGPQRALDIETYDANGAMVSRTEPNQAADTYTFDHRGRLVEATVDGQTVAMGYDDAGNRVRRTHNGVTTTYLNDSANPTGYTQTLEQFTGGQLTRTYTLGLDVIGQSDDAISRWHYVYDGHGSVRALADVQGYVKGQSLGYDAYGNLVRPGQTDVDEASSLQYSGE